MGMFIDDENCTCNACGRKFSYGDKWSPSFNETIWHKLVQAFGLEKHEIEAERKFYKLFRQWDRLGRPEDLGNKLDGPEYHTYICYKCAEKALGRKIRKTDLIGKNVPLNYNFEKYYFGET